MEKSIVTYQTELRIIAFGCNFPYFINFVFCTSRCINYYFVTVNVTSMHSYLCGVPILDYAYRIIHDANFQIF